MGHAGAGKQALPFAGQAQQARRAVAVGSKAQGAAGVVPHQSLAHANDQLAMQLAELACRPGDKDRAQRYACSAKLRSRTVVQNTTLAPAPPFGSQTAQPRPWQRLKTLPAPQLGVQGQAAAALACERVGGVQYKGVLRGHHLLQQHRHEQVCRVGWGGVLVWVGG